MYDLSFYRLYNKYEPELCDGCDNISMMAYEL